MNTLEVMRRVLTAYDTHDLLGMEAYMQDLRRVIERAERQQDDFAYREAVSLAKAIFTKHFAHEEHYASGRIVWEPLDTTAGVISQIDNMTCQLVAPPQRQPLTDGEIIEHFKARVDTGSLLSFADGVRFAERKHGIGETK